MKSLAGFLVGSTPKIFGTPTYFYNHWSLQIKICYRAWPKASKKKQEI